MNQNQNPEWTRIQESVARLRTEVSKAVVGQEAIVEQLLVSTLCSGHCLIVGVPGLAKTLLVNTIAKVLGLSFHRIQFTPDLMPSDILGSEILQETESGRAFQFVRGPIFANLILADEINRTPPKTQSALLEAMQEKQVTVAGKTMELQRPFLVIATQNPIENEGTYPLPEAQLDRFFFSLNIGYPSLEEEREIVIRAAQPRQEPETVLDAATLLQLQQSVYEVPLPENVLEAILKLVTASRPDMAGSDDYTRQYIAWGAGPRASLTLAHAVRALALLRSRPTPSVEEVRDIAAPVLRHRVIPSYNATGEGITTDAIIAKLLEQI